MKRLNIFKAGTHTSASGATLSFSESDLQASVDAYDPKLHEAPITIGHPKDNLPAYGWIQSLAFSEDRGLDATPHQVYPDFADMVSNNLFKKISSSFYSPDAPNNPVPGVYYLRHVAFLGAQPPAVKGLKSVEYSEAEEGVVEFSEPWDTQATAGMFRRLREFIIEKFSKDEADQVIPEYAISELEDSARRQIIKPEQPTLPSNFNDPEDSTMDTKELDAEKAKLQSRADELAAKENDFAEREKRINAAEAESHKAIVVAKVGALVSAGKILPAERERVTSFACALNADTVVEFKEGEETKKVASSALFFEFLEGLKSRIDINEHSKEDEQHTPPSSPAELAKMAVNYREEQSQKGITVSATEAVMHVQKQHSAA